jgi:hypothetical protein
MGKSTSPICAVFIDDTKLALYLKYMYENNEVFKIAPHMKIFDSYGRESNIFSINVNVHGETSLDSGGAMSVDWNYESPSAFAGIENYNPMKHKIDLPVEYLSSGNPIYYATMVEGYQRQIANGLARISNWNWVIQPSKSINPIDPDSSIEYGSIIATAYGSVDMDYVFVFLKDVQQSLYRSAPVSSTTPYNGGGSAIIIDG